VFAGEHSRGGVASDAAHPAAGREALIRCAESPPQLAPAIQMTIGAAPLHGVLLAAALIARRAFS
jgi:hypothetical protein